MSDSEIQRAKMLDEANRVEVEVEQQKQEAEQLRLKELEEQKIAEAAVEAKVKEPQAESQDQWRKDPVSIQNVEEYSSDPLMSLAAKGTYDTLKKAIGLVPWLGKPTEEALPTIPPEDSKGTEFVRDLGGILMPMMAGNWLVGATGRAVNSRVMLSNTTKFIGEKAALLGVDVGVTYTAASSGKDDNLARMFSDWTGVELPWATNDNDTGPVRRLKHVIDGAGWFGVGEIVGVVSLIKNPFSARGIDDLSQEAVTKLTPKINPDNPLQSANDVVAGQRNTAVKAETIRRMEAGPGNVGPYGEVTSGDLRAIDNVPGMAVQKHDPFIHKYTEPHETFISNTDANPIQAKMEIGERQMNPKYRKSASSETPAYTEHFERDLLNITEPGLRRDKLTESFTPISKAIETVRDNKIVRSSAENNRAIDDLTNEVFDLDIQDLSTNVIGMRNNVYKLGDYKISYVDDQSFIQLGNAYKEVFETMYNPNHIRTSAVMAHSAREGATEIASSINMIPSKNTGNLQVKMMEKLQVLAQEVRLSQFIWASSGNYKQLAEKLGSTKKWTKKGRKKLTNTERHKMMAEWLQNEKGKFDEFLKNNAKQSREMVKVWKDIAEKKPEMLKPFSELVMLTNGDVKTLEHLDNYLKKSLGPKGTLRAAFLSDEKVPNLIIEGLIQLNYNAKLGIGAIKNTFEGNALALLLKPISMTLGAVRMGDMGAAAKHLNTYAGFSESLKRGMMVAADQYDFALKNPRAAAISRPDLLQREIDSWQFHKSMDKVWEKNGDVKYRTMYNIARMLNGSQNHPLSRYGSLGMAPQDGFVKGMVMSAHARSEAYKFAMDPANYKNNETWNSAFYRANQDVYSKFFDKDGVLLQENFPKNVEYTAREMALQGEDDVAQMLSHLNQKAPLIRAIMSFPTTMVNGVKFVGTFNPFAGRIAEDFGIGKMGKTLAAETLEQKKEVLALHGIKEYSEQAFNEIKHDYLGRQMFGMGVVFSAALYCSEGNLTGFGPEEYEDKKNWMDLGNKPLHINLPGIGLYDYSNKEPFTTLLATVGDVCMQARRTDSSFTENQFKKMVTLFMGAPTQKDVMRPFNTLLRIIAGDKNEAARFAGYTAASFVPSKATMTWFNNVFMPGMKEIRNEAKHYLAANFKFLDPKDEYLVDVIDPHTKEPINYEDWQCALVNNTLPFLQCNPGQEPWRKFLIRSGWKGVREVTENKYTGEKITPEERFFINNYIGENGNLIPKIEELMDENTSNGARYWASLRSFEAEWDTFAPFEKRSKIEDMEHVQMLNTIYGREIEKALQALRYKYTEFHEIGSLRDQAKAAEERGDAVASNKLRARIFKKNKAYNTKLRSDYKKDKFGF